MLSRWMRAAALLAMAPAAALAFETVDLLPWPSSGRFPAYAADTPLRPTMVWAYAGAMHDTNVLRRTTGEQSETIGRLGVGARAGLRFAERQTFVLEGIGEYYDYGRFDSLDHFAYALRGEWFWEIGNQLAGTAGYTRRRRQVDLGELQAEIQDIVIEERVFATGAYRFTPDWRVAGAAEHSRASREADREADLRRSTVRGGLEHVSPLGNAIGAEARLTRGDAPVEETVPGLPAAVNNDFEERELAATLTYGLGAQLRIGGRLGHTERSYTELSGRDFSGTTYRGRVDWLPERKLILSFEAYREPASIIDVGASHVLRTGTAFGASWAATFKLVFTARFLNERRENQADPAIALLGIPARDETLRVWRFGAGWEPQRHWQLGAGFDIGERTSNQLGRDYDYTQAMLNLRFTY
jgi:hypothetical protein